MTQFTFPSRDIVHHAGKLRPLKIRPGYIVIAIHIKYADIRILACKIPKKLNLVANGVSFSFRSSSTEIRAYKAAEYSVFGVGGDFTGATMFFLLVLAISNHRLIAIRNIAVAFPEPVPTSRHSPAHAQTQSPRSCLHTRGSVPYIQQQQLL